MDGRRELGADLKRCGVLVSSIADFMSHRHSRSARALLGRQLGKR
jgi:hypothetical protein